MDLSSFINLGSGLLQGGLAISKGAERKSAERELERMQVPMYRPNRSILDFYDEALRKYKTSPTDSAEYKMDKQNIMQGTTQGLSSLNKLRSGDVSNIIQNQNNSLLKAAVKAEQNKRNQAGIVLNAAGQQAAELDRQYQYNQIWPFQKKYNLLALKAANSAKAENAYTQGAFNSISSAAGGMGGGSGGGGGTGMGALGGLMGGFGG